MLSRKEEHLEVAESFFVYIDFGIDDERTRRDQERKMWLEILYSVMTKTEYEEIKNIPNSPFITTDQDEHILPVRECETSGSLACRQTRSKDDSGIRTIIVHHAPVTGRKPRLL